jgi:uncharacterized membrane protein YidH (DUF202 family)
MKTFLEVLGIIVLLFVLAVVNVGMNSWKRNDCFEQGGRYIENTSDSTASACILGK